MNMLIEKDFYEGYPVIHENADTRKVQERLAWLWKWNHSNVFASLATIWYDQDAVNSFNKQA